MIMPATAPDRTTTRFAFGPFHLLADRHELLAHGVPVAIGQRALDVLLALVRRHGALVTKDELMREVWPGVTVEENNLAVHISALRKVLGQTDDGKPYLQTVAGRGYRFVAPTSHDDAPPAPSSAADAASNNLPQLLTSLIGRADVLDVLKARLKDHRLVTLTGSGGVGKTRLAVAVGEELVEAYPDGVWMIDLASIRDAEIVASVVSAVLGVGLAGATIQGLAATLKSRRLLLILDNCEHLVAASAQLAESLIRICPQLSILATSRERLAIAGESVFQVPPLSGPATSEGLTAQDALRFPAVQLFVERATALGEGFTLSDDNAATVAAICRRIDGIPLAIELAVPRLRVLSERELASGLDRRFALLTGGSRTADPRHQTLHALIGWSYELLSAAEQGMLRRLSVFAGSTALASIAAVTADSAGIDVLDLTTSLVEKSLLLASRRTEETRYLLAESTRHFGHDKLIAAGEQSWHRRHAAHFAERFAQASETWETEPPERWLARYGVDIDNLRAALAWAFGPGGDEEIGLALVGSGHVIWSELGLLLEHRHWVARALSAVNADTAQAVLARLLSWQAGDVKDADDPADFDDALRAAALYAALGDRFQQGRMLLRAGTSRLLHDATDGERLLREALALLRPFGNTKTLARGLSALASGRLFAGDMPGAQALHQEALAVTRSLATALSA
jgi:predicted ATPase/DNA-binding winged helix-turn-helix (wHTH) protein